jgi:hypothetical protein
MMKINMRVKMRDEDILSTPEFLGKKGTVIGLGRAPEGYAKVKFDRFVRGREWWHVPMSDLEIIYETPAWEV